MDPNAQPQASNDLTQKIPTTSQSTEPENPQKKSTKFLFPLLIGFLLLIFIIPSIVFLIYKPAFLNSNKVADNSSKTKNIEAQKQNIINDKAEMEKLDQTSSNEINLEKLSESKDKKVVVECVKNEKENIDALYVEFKTNTSSKNTSWIFTSSLSKLINNTKHTLPTGGLEDLSNNLIFILQKMNEEYSSNQKDSNGNITINSFEGCETGDNISFTINANLQKVDSIDANETIQITGSFTGAVEDKSLNPEDNDTERKSAVVYILNAVGAYASDNSGTLPSAITKAESEISSDGADLCEYLVPKYIPGLPMDPLLQPEPLSYCPESYKTGYNISADDEGRITVSAPKAELTIPIQVSR